MLVGLIGFKITNDSHVLSLKPPQKNTISHYVAIDSDITSGSSSSRLFVLAKDLVENVDEDVGVTALEDQRRSETDRALAVATHQDAFTDTHTHSEV